MDNISLPLDIESVEIIDQKIDSEGKITLTVKSKNKHSTCHKCGKPATKEHGTAPKRTIQHTTILDRPVYIEIEPIRYQCESCDDRPTTTEQYDWCSRNAKVTHALENYLMRCLINSTVQDVSTKTGVAYKTIVKVIGRLVDKNVDWAKYAALYIIGLDEITLKKGHNDYVTVVSARQKNGDLSVIAILEGREKETVKSFLMSIPAKLKKTVKQVCTDMYDGYVNAAVEVCGHKSVVIDRYHVAKLYRKGVDKLRISEMKRLKSLLTEAEYSELEGMMWILRKNNECLSNEDKVKLKQLYRYSPLLKKAHSYAIRLTHIFNTHQNRKSGMAKLDRWIDAVSKSDVTCFNRFIITLKKHKKYISNYFKNRSNSGFVEGLNNKIKVIKRRCYGIFKTETLFQRLHLDLVGFKSFSVQFS